jgi:hypothetical protein
MYKILDNFGPEDYNNNLLSMFTSDHFSWFYHNYVSQTNETTDNEFYFTHTFWSDKNREVNSNYFDSAIVPILFLLSSKDEDLKLVRAKANLFTQRDKVMKYGFHTDYTFEKHTTLVYSVNTNNGYTEFKDGTKIPSVAKQLLIFDGNIPHRSVGQTDTNNRINLNINLEIDPKRFIDE